MNEIQTHIGDCTIYSSLCNNQPTDGICTCGYGWSRVRLGEGDWSEMYSKEKVEEQSNRVIESKLLDAATTLLAEWCVQVMDRGSSWDDWDSWYKKAAYSPGPLREIIDQKMEEYRKKW